MDKLISWGLVVVAVITVWATYLSDNHLFVG
jgi:hypothetical protein